MLFSSITFLFFFLPAVLLLSLPLRGWLGNLLLLLASLAFYAWGEQFYVLVMLVSILVNHLFGLVLDASSSPSRRRWCVAFAVLINLGLLISFKYAEFIVQNVNTLLRLIDAPSLPSVKPHLPIGISFFTFQALSYVLDVYRGESRAQRNPLNTALFISLYPQLIAGPIVRYASISEQLVHRRVTLQGLAEGARRFTLGLGKKVLIANQMAVVADGVFALAPQGLTPTLAWMGTVAYTLQIYFDFSGYSDMAIGLGRMHGFHFSENFDYPYVARSIRDFWRRWHISLSTWFRDYLYLPLGGNRVSPLRTYGNLLVVFLLCGLWHGAQWTFVLWGLYHGAFLVIERMGFQRLLERTPRPLRHGYALLVIMVGWVLFRSESTTQALTMAKNLVGLSDGADANLRALEYGNSLFLTVLGIAIVASLPILPWWRRQLERSSGADASHGLLATRVVADVTGLALMAGILILCAMSLASGTYNPFIYFRF